LFKNGAIQTLKGSLFVLKSPKNLKNKVAGKGNKEEER
jgi:hypothetical protein